MKHQSIDSQGDGAGASGHKYKLEVNGVTIAVSSETGMVTARELLKSAEKAKALVTVLDGLSWWMTTTCTRVMRRSTLRKREPL